MNVIAVFGILFFVVWLSVYGMTMIMGQHQRFARWTGRMIRRAAHYLWIHYRQFIIGFGIGFLLASLYFSGRLP